MLSQLIHHCCSFGIIQDSKHLSHILDATSDMCKLMEFFKKCLPFVFVFWDKAMQPDLALNLLHGSDQPHVLVLLQDPSSLQRAGITGGHNDLCCVYICAACDKPSTSHTCYISLHQRCEDNSNDLILLRDKQESQTLICLRAVACGSGCGKRRSGRGESKARNVVQAPSSSHPASSSQGPFFRVLFFP